MKKALILIIITIIVLVASFLNLTFFLDKPVVNYDDNSYLYINGIKTSDFDSVIVSNNIYIKVKYLKENNLIDYYWDKENSIITLFNNYELFKVLYNNYKASMNDSIIKRDHIEIFDENLYLSIKLLNEIYELNIIYDDNSNNVYIENNLDEYTVVQNTRLRIQPSYNSNPIDKIQVGEKLYGYEINSDDWILVRMEDYKIGYINKETVKIDYTKKEIAYTNNVEKKDKIILAWDFFTRKLTEFEEFEIPNGITVLAPTWHSLQDDDNYFKDFSNKDYVEYVKKNGVEVWGVFNNSFDLDLTSKLLNDSKTRSEIIDEIINTSINNKYDGINIDFENMYLKDKDVFSVFIKELYCKAKKENIPLSVDITILSNSETWSRCFDRDVIGYYSDYVVLMAYDENVGANSIGSVSTIPWVEYGVENLLEYTKSNKVILGIPFYTRLWQVDKNSGKFIESNAYRLKSSKEKLDELGITLYYNEESGQNYGDKIINNIKYLIWFEDETSLNNRIDIVDKYNLSGTAVWCLDYGIESMWNELKNRFKK